MVLTVTQLNEYVRRSLAMDPVLASLELRGEMSNFKRHSSGHWYFTLKDEGAQVRCAMFRGHNDSVRFLPQDGMRVVISGSASLYARDGQFQVYAEKMMPDGVGALFQAYEARKAALMAEGLFDASLKKPLPLLPRLVGIVTSPTGAAVQDIIRVSKRRNAGVQLLLAPARVQGQGAAEEIARAIEALDAYGVDVIIAGRGGGSLEELWAFNEEIVARAIFACRAPVVSAVGHETDFTIADFVADLRASTPSVAAELAVPERSALVETVDGAAMRLAQATLRRLDRKMQSVDALEKRINRLSPARKLADYRLRLHEGQSLIHKRMTAALSSRTQALSGLWERIRALDPSAVLSRGYALVSVNGHVASQIKQINPDDRVDIRLRDGSFEARVEKIRGEES